MRIISTDISTRHKPDARADLRDEAAARRHIHARKALRKRDVVSSSRTDGILKALFAIYFHEELSGIWTHLVSLIVERESELRHGRSFCVRGGACAH